MGLKNIHPLVSAGLEQGGINIRNSADIIMIMRKTVSFLNNETPLIALDHRPGSSAALR